jgi:beta-glucosidase
VHNFSKSFSKFDFGDDFVWGVSSSAWQTEGMANVDNKGVSIWDEFAMKRKSLFKEAYHASDFYNRYKEDLDLMQQMGIKNFRFSIAWTRILPDGMGAINQKGIDFYNKLIDACLLRGIQPWITLYHWDLPQTLQLKGGWRNREIVDWFTNYVKTVTRYFGDRVKKWMVLNEPMVYTGAGYFLGVHAPGSRNLTAFLNAIHNSVLVQGSIPDVIRSMVSNAEVGTTFSCAHLEPANDHPRHHNALKRADLLLNTLFAEPLMGNGYNVDGFRSLERLNDLVKGDDLNLMKGNYDFIGLQNYTREVIKHSWYIPYLKAKIIGASKRKVNRTTMNWEVYPPSIYHVLKKFSKYPFIKKIYITENGGSFHDFLIDGSVMDTERKNYLKEYISQVLRAKNEGVNVAGYFVWSFTDNVEWAEGCRPRFGIVYVDFKTQQRYIKDSGRWYAEFLKGKKVNANVNQDKNELELTGNVRFKISDF